MGQTNSKPTDTNSGTERLYHFDNLRTILTILVIFHHTSIPYGGLGSWQYISPQHVQGSSLIITTFNAINQTYFMGLFFYLSGKMSSQSLKRRKSTRGFLKTKWLKLGIPVMVYTFFGLPSQIAAMRAIRGENVNFLDVLLGHWKMMRGVRGPVWYSSLLLLFDTAYSLLPPLSLPNLGVWPIMALNISAILLLRIPSPAQKIFAPLNVQPGYFPQYLIAYILGTRSSQSNSPRPLPLSKRRNATLLATSVLSGYSIIGLLRAHPGSYSLASLSTSLNPVSISYAVWNESTGLLIGTSLMRLFERKEWGRRRWGGVGQYSYAAFLVHPVVCVGVQSACEGLKISAVGKSVVCGTLGALGSWGVAWGLVRVPGVSRVLL